MATAHSKKDNEKFITTEAHELPPALRKSLATAKRLEWWTIAYLISVILVVFLVLGSSQAMKTAWLEDILSIIPSVLFLVAYALFEKMPPSHHYPYGLHKVFSVAFLLGSFALLS